MFLGSHVETSKPLLTGIKNIISNGGNVIQVFLRKMHSSSKKDRIQLSIKEQNDINSYLKKNKVLGFVHASYLLNFCRVPEGLIRIQWAYDMLKEDIDLGEKLGLKGIVIHMCSRNAVNEKWKPITLTLDETINRNIKHIDYFLKNNTFKIKLLIENSSSEGNKIGGKLIEFGKVFKPIYKKYKNRIGTCIDTCHAFASGYPINTILGINNFLNDYKKYVGPYSTINLIHLNDSEFPLGSKKDRHSNIGKGYIFKDVSGKEALYYLISFAIKHKIPMCLETPSGSKKDLDLIKKIYFNKIDNIKGGGKITKNEVIKLLEEFQEYHKSLGNNIKASQYSKAINSIKESNIKKITSGSDLFDLQFVGRGIISKIDEFINTGKIELLENFKKNPIVIAHKELTKVFGIGPKKAKALISEGILDIADLKRAEKKELVKLTSSQKVGLKYYEDLQQRIPRKESENIKNIIEKEFKKIYGENASAELAGSYYMGKKTSGDIDIVLFIKNINKIDGILQDFVTYLYNNNILLDSLSGSKIPNSKSNNYMGIIKNCKKIARHIDLHIVKEEELPFHMLYFGSGEQFSRMIRKIAKTKGYKLNEKGLYKGKDKVNVKTEKDIFNILDINWVSPEKRKFD
jgi:apurinic endonuclease APN1